jgi:hypothetical protein
VADSLLDINYPTVPLLATTPNWATRPSSKMAMTRRLVGHFGTSHQLISLTDDCPLTFEAGYTFVDKSEDNTIITFFIARRGRVQRFWVFHPHRLFRLKVAASNASDFMGCYPNDFHLQYQGYERIYIRMNDGDILTRAVTAASYNEGEDRLDLTLDSNLDRDIGLTEYDVLGRCLLVRFDTDTLRLRALTDSIGEAKLSFAELVQEYSEIP